MLLKSMAYLNKRWWLPLKIFTAHTQCDLVGGDPVAFLFIAFNLGIFTERDRGQLLRSTLIPPLLATQMKEKLVSRHAKSFQCESATIKIHVKPLHVNQTNVKGEFMESEVMAQNMLYSPPRKSRKPVTP